MTAAFRAIVRDGYEATSVKDLAREAGVTPGLVHYYFESKDELVYAAIDAACEKFFHARRDGRDDLTASEEARLRLAGMKQLMRPLRDFWVLVFEMNARAFHDPKVRALIRNFLERDRAEIERLVEGVVAEAGIESELPPRAIASAIYGAITGMIWQKLVDPKFDFDAAIDALEAMAFALVRRSA